MLFSRLKGEIMIDYYRLYGQLILALVVISGLFITALDHNLLYHANQSMLLHTCSACNSYTT